MRSPARQPTVTVALPGRTLAVVARRVVGVPGSNALTEVGTREPPPDVGTRELPPDVGMHPTNGLKLGDRGDVPTYTPRKVTDRDVVMPGLTGLPSLPRKLTSIAR